jgi:ABC-type lipoprotein release transport system permease subunit
MDGLALIPPLAWRNLWCHRGRTFLTILAVTIAVAFMVILGSLLAAWSNSAFDRTTAALTGHGQIHAAGFSDDPAVERSMPPPGGPLAAALAQDMVKAWTPRVVAPALIRSERESAPITLYGIDPEREAAVSFLNSREVEGAALVSSEAQGLVIGRRLAERLQVAPGRRVVIAAHDVNGDIKEIGITVIGFYRGQPDLQMFAVFASLAQTQKFLGLGNHISEIAFLATDRSVIGRLADSLAKSAPDLDVKRWDQLQPFSSAVIEMTDNANTIWVFASFALVAFGLINTIMMVVYERMREFGLMQALGMKPHLLIAQVLLESTYLVLFGTLFGAALGIGAILALAGGLDLGSLGVGASMFGASERLYPQVDASQIVLACGAVVGLSIVASVYPVLRATRRVPISILTRAQT